MCYLYCVRLIEQPFDLSLVSGLWGVRLFVYAGNIFAGARAAVEPAFLSVLSALSSFDFKLEIKFLSSLGGTSLGSSGMGGFSVWAASRFRACRLAGNWIDGPLAKFHDFYWEEETLTRARWSFPILTSPGTHGLSFPSSGLFLFQHNFFRFCGIWSKAFYFKMHYAVFYESWEETGFWRSGGSWKSNAIKFRWDPGGPVQSFKLRLFSWIYRITVSLSATDDQWPKFYRISFFVLFGNNVFDEPGLGEGSVNSYSPHIWGTVGDTLTRTNDLVLEACL